MNNIPLSERPRERLIERGASTLSDEELLAVILGSGSSRAGVYELAQKVLEVVDRENGEFGVKSVLDIAGIGAAKATMLCAALEFVKRRIRPEGVKIRQPSDIVPLIKHLLDRKQECFVVTTLNGAHEVIETRVITVGLLNFCNVHPREVYCDAILDRAAAIIAAHNLCGAPHKLCYVKCAFMWSMCVPAFYKFRLSKDSGLNIGH